MNTPLDTTPGYTVSELHEQAPCCIPQAHLAINNLSVRYGQKAVLSGVSLAIQRGCITALIGPSGCGKTSFLSSLNRLVDMVPGCSVSGSILLDGDEILTASTDVLMLRRRIGMIFQRPNPFPLSIRRNLDMPLQEHGFKNKMDRERRIEQALRDVGLWQEVSDRLDAPALGLSGGQQQRLCIARALVLEPEILLMDEPCSALDPISSGVVEDLISRLGGRYTVIIVTHNLAQARRIANYTAFFWMQDQVGQLIEFGACQQLFDAPTDALTAAYINGTRG
jgi:phosphate transport system ATP-binding protein